MYKFIRDEIPPHLDACWEKLTQKFIAAKARNPKYKFSWYAPFQYDYTLSLLFEMTQGHCAFCDGGDIGAESRRTIEHFYPKSEYKELAYQWTNLYPCCDQCQSQKLERFDPHLLAPDSNGYHFDDYFTVNYRTGAIEPSGFANAENQYQARVTIEHYGLDLEERRKARQKELKRYQQRDRDTDIKDDFSYRYFLDDLD